MVKDIFIAVLSALITSAGFWTFLTKFLDKKSAKSKMILGLGHNTIMTLCTVYIQRGRITSGEYEDLRKYLYEPYKAMGGNGSIDRLMRAVDALPIVSDDFREDDQNGIQR